MEVHVEQTSLTGRKVTVIVPRTVVFEQFQTRLKAISGNVKVNGFRPGKTPINVVKRHYGEQVREEVLEIIIKQSVEEAIRQENLSPINELQMRIIADAENADFVFSLDFDVRPTFAFDDLDALPVTCQQGSVSDSDVDAMIEKLRFQHATFLAVERSAQLTDKLTIDVWGCDNGQRLTEAPIEDYVLQLDAGNSSNAKFGENLLGMQIGEQKTFEVHFDENDPNKTLAGKSLSFDVTVKQIEAMVLPELEPAFFELFGSSELSDFRLAVRENLERELEQRNKLALQNALLDGLRQALPFELPERLVADKRKELRLRFIESLKNAVKDEPTIIEAFKKDPTFAPDSNFDENARANVATTLIISAIIAQCAIDVDEQRVRRHVEEHAQTFEKPQQVIEWYYKDEKRLDDIRQQVLLDQVLDWIKDRAELTIEPVDFDTIVNDYNS